MLEKISICIATYKRFEMLSNCVLQINKLDIPTNVELNVIIVDGEQATPKERIKHIKQISKFSLSYNISKKNGISSNRNQLMDFALEKNADYIAFIDDDEYPNKNWIFNLYTNLKKYNADVVRGGVNYIKPLNLNPKTPLYLIEYCCSKSKSKKSGIYNGAITSGNVLFRSKLIKKQKLYFDNSFDFMGGEDIDYFFRSKELGNIHAWENNAAVNETVLESRISLKYIFKRNFSVAISKIIMHKKYNNIFKTYIYFSIKLLSKLIKSIILIPSIFKHKKNILKFLANFSYFLGCIYGLLGLKINRYNSVDGN